MATIALRQLDLRRQRRPQGCATKAEHEARLRPWAALAIRAGADLAAVSPDAPACYEDYRQAGCSDAEARALVADDLCPLPQVVAALATARDAALDALPLAASAAPASTSDLVVLAIHFGCPGYAPRKLERAA
ncbi:hypothetical protein [Tsuneonella sp. HG222]